MNNQPAPHISIIIPTYNNAASLKNCLDNIIGLTGDSTEIIVIDGGSQDGTRQVLEQYSERIHWVSEPDEGIYDALNKGCRHARGQFFYFLGADDLVTGKFRTAAELLVNKRTIYYGDVILAESGKIYDGRFSTFRLARTNISHQAIFYPRSVFESCRYTERYPIQADWELNMRLWNDPDYQFSYVNLPIARFGQDGISSHRQDTSFNEDYLKLIRTNFPLHIYFHRRILSGMLSCCKKVIPASIIDKLNKLPFQI